MGSGAPSKGHQVSATTAAVWFILKPVSRNVTGTGSVHDFYAQNF